jgi:hypothetical protein
MAHMNETPTNPPLQFGLRTLLEIIAVAAFVLALMAYRQPETVTIPEPSRYESHTIDDLMYVVDTQTGELWRYERNGSKWYPDTPIPRVDE